MTEEQLAAVRGDLTLSGLNFSLLRRKLLTKWRFYLCVSMLQCFAAFPVHEWAPVDASRDLKVTPAVAESMAVQPSPLLFKLPRYCVFAYMPPPVTLAKDARLAEALNSTFINPGGECADPEFTGWMSWPGAVTYFAASWEKFEALAHESDSVEE